MIFKILFNFVLLFTSAFGFASNAHEADSFLWKISKQGQPDSYLLGTLHLGKINSKLPEPYMQALKQSERLIVESSADDFSNPKYAHDAKQLIWLMADSRTLNQSLGKQRMDAIGKILKYGQSNVPYDGNSYIKPWAFWWSLQIGYTPKGYTFENGIDYLLINAAKKQNKPVTSLELLEPVYFMSEIPDDVLIRSLDALLVHYREVADEHKLLVDLYAKQQSAKLWQKVIDDQDLLKFMPKQDHAYWKYFMHQKLLNERNQKWVKRLDNVLPGKSTLVAVGAAHLFGQQGLIEQLRLRGYQVEPVKQ